MTRARCEVVLDGQFPWAGPAGRQKVCRRFAARSAGAGRPFQYSLRTENEHSRLSRHPPAQVAPDHGRQGAGRRRRADQRADHDQHHHLGCARHHRADSRHRGGRRRHRARLLPGRGRHQGDEGDHQGRRHSRSWPTSISTTSAPSRRRRRARPACASIPAISAARHACKRSGAGRQGSWLLHAHRRQCRVAGNGPAGKIWRAVPRSDGGKRAQPRQDSR